MEETCGLFVWVYRLNLTFANQFNKGIERQFIGIYTWGTDYMVNMSAEGDDVNSVHHFQRQLF